MRLAVPAVGLLLARLVTSPAGAGAADMLYATAASQGRVDGFRLDRRGDIATAPAVQVATARNPRRVFVVGCVLYVAQDDRVETFRIKGGGGLQRLGRTVVDPDMRPTDFVTSVDQRVLYVAQKALDRVVAYPLGAGGEPTGACTCTQAADCNGADGSCVAGRCASGTRACVVGSTDACAAEQTCVMDFTSCALGEVGIRYQTLAVSNDVLFAGGAGLGSGIDAFRRDAAGNLPTAFNCSCTADAECDGSEGSCVAGRCVRGATSCTPGAPDSCPASAPGAANRACVFVCDPASGTRTLTRPVWCRRRLHGPRLAVDAAGVLYVEDRLRGRILGFKQLGSAPLVDVDDGKVLCTDTTANCVCSNKKRVRDSGTGVVVAQQAPDTKTAPVAPYEKLLIHDSTLFASEFQRGRVDAYSLRPGAAHFIAKRPRRSSEDVRMSPVGMAAADGVLYLAGGEVDRVRAYRMHRRRSDGVLVGLSLTSETEEQNGSFPNDVAVAVLGDTCQ